MFGKHIDALSTCMSDKLPFGFQTALQLQAVMSLQFAELIIR